MRLGIDASNLRSGGSITHIAELIRWGDPEAHGIAKVTLWGAAITLERVPERPWLDRVHVPQLERPLPMRVAWQLFKRPALARAACDVLFTPAATPPGGFHPLVSMSQLTLPFDARERRRYGFSADHARLLILRYVIGSSFRQADAVIFLTDFAKETIGRLVDHGIDARSVVIPHGVSTYFQAPPRPALPLDAYSVVNPFRFVYVSDQHPYKHQATVAEAVLRMRRAKMPIELDLIGSPVIPSVARELQKTLARHPAERDAVRIMNSVPHSALPEFYREAGAFVFASTCENLPVTLLEAMASGLPIVASDARPMPDIIGDAGTYFDAEDVASIEAALRRVAEDRELRERSAALAYERAAAYSWKKCADATFALLARVGRV